MTNPAHHTIEAAVAEPRDRLPLPYTVALRNIRWSYLLPIALVHLLALLAVMPWLFIPGPFVLRRFVRVRRGLCPACAYPVGPSGACSECGKPLPGRMAVTT